MRLPPATLDELSILNEFDQWVTPSLGDIRQTEKFISELDSLHALFSRICERAGDTAPIQRTAVYQEVEEAFTYGSPTEASYRLIVLLSSVFLATGKSDNAVKCQYPIAYLHKFGHSYPRIKGRTIAQGLIPKVLKSTDIVDNAVRLSKFDDALAKKLLIDYVDFLLFSPQDDKQILSLLEAFRQAERRTLEGGRHLLAPLVVFQVRGSVAATGGHDPEEFVRSYAREWGLEPHIDFNTTDMTAQELHHWLELQDDPYKAAIPAGVKTRAFDFIMPCKSSTANRRVFVQSQFYAGDSGSVSHKNVDQAAGARKHAVSLFPSALFVELVDGAGYCASLRKDLQHLIFADDTYDFVQIRSIPVRLRRIMQASGVFTPLDLGLRVQAGHNTPASLRNSLISDGATEAAFQELLQTAFKASWIEQNDDLLALSPERVDTISEYHLLDAIVIHGQKIKETESARVLLVPGYGPNFGVLRDVFDHDPDVAQKLIDRGIVQTKLMAL